MAEKVIEQVNGAENIIADKAYDSHNIRQKITQQGAKSVIPRKRNSLIGNADVDKERYKYRHLVENALARLKQFRGIATRYDKLKRNFISAVALACTYLWLPM